MRLYEVSRDEKSGLYYIHTKGYPYIPVLGSFTEKKSEATKLAATAGSPEFQNTGKQ